MTSNAQFDQIFDTISEKKSKTMEYVGGPQIRKAKK